MSSRMRESGIGIAESDCLTTFDHFGVVVPGESTRHFFANHYSNAGHTVGAYNSSSTQLVFNSTRA